MQARRAFLLVSVVALLATAAAGTAGAANNATVDEQSSSVPAAGGPGSLVAVRVRVVNTGDTVWRAGSAHRLGATSANQLAWSAFACGGYARSLQDARVYLCQDVAPGQGHDFQLSVTLPASGSAVLSVRMVQDGVLWFGETQAFTIAATGGCPNAPLATPADRWKLEIFDNRALGGSTVEQRYDAAGAGGFSFDWGTGRPSPCAGVDTFGIRFSRTISVAAAGDHRFTTTTDDGARLYLDGQLLIDRWVDQAPTSASATRALSAGTHELRMDYYENGGGAVAALRWEAATPNRPPVAQATATPSSGVAPLAVRLDGSGSSDPDGDTLSFSWDFGDGQGGAGAAVNHTYASAGSTTATLTVSDGRGGTAKALVSVTATAPPSGTNLVSNGDFAQGLSGWRVWRERGAQNPVVNAAGQLQLAGSGINGGVYQQFGTGGAGRTITIDGWWASSPTVAQAQWAEVLVLNGSALPVDGQDVNGNQAGVVLVYKADTWAKPGGWSGDMRQTAVRVVGSFVSAGSVATIVLKVGNGTGTTGALYDNLVVRGPDAPPPPPENRPPTAQALARPSSGAAPLTVELDGTGSSDPDGDPLTYAWDFGGGDRGSGATASHTYDTPGSYTAALTVSDGRGGSGSASVLVEVTSTEPPGTGPNLVTNPSFEKSFSAGGVAEGWQAWTGSGQGYWKKSSRLGRIGSGSYAGGGQVLTAVKRLNPKVILLEGNAFGMAAELRRTFPDALMVGRLYIDPVTGQYLTNPEYYGRKHAEDCLAAGRPEIEVWQGLNEPYVNDVESARRVARFEKAFSDRIQELGKKSVVFNLAVGNPGDMNIMLLPEIVATLATADYAGYHTYSSPKDQRLVGPQSAWYAHRWRFYASLYRERGLRMPPVLYTEMNEWSQWKEGRTPPGVPPSQPWEIRDDFIAFERESATDPWAVGIAIFLFGSSSAQFEGRETANEPVIYEAAGDHNWSHPADARGGVASQQFGSEASGFAGGLVQRLAVEADVEHLFTTSLKFETRQPGSDVVLRMGYDPSGQTADGNAGTIEWSDDLVSAERRESDVWYASSLRFVPDGPQASIWVSVSSHKPVRVSLDDVKLEQASP